MKVILLSIFRIMWRKALEDIKKDITSDDDISDQENSDSSDEKRYDSDTMDDSRVFPEDNESY